MALVLLFAGVLLLLLGISASVPTTMAGTKPRPQHSRLYGVTLLAAGAVLVATGGWMLLT
jgi:hypothetical protein